MKTPARADHFSLAPKSAPKVLEIFAGDPSLVGMPLTIAGESEGGDAYCSGQVLLFSVEPKLLLSSASARFDVVMDDFLKAVKGLAVAQARVILIVGYAPRATTGGGLEDLAIHISESLPYSSNLEAGSGLRKEKSAEERRRKEGGGEISTHKMRAMGQRFSLRKPTRLQE